MALLLLLLCGQTSPSFRSYRSMALPLPFQLQREGRGRHGALHGEGLPRAHRRDGRTRREGGEHNQHARYCFAFCTLHVLTFVRLAYVSDAGSRCAYALILSIARVRVPCVRPRLCRNSVEWRPAVLVT